MNENFPVFVSVSLTILIMLMMMSLFEKMSERDRNRLLLFNKPDVTKEAKSKVKTYLCLRFLCSGGTIDFSSPLNSDSICNDTSYITPGSYSLC